MRKTLYALVDCTSFYCSCERAFRPDLKDKPICVLSNNDGCIISLTSDTKALGFKMGAPYYKVKDELRAKGVTVFSSNYCLYADMSKRVVKIVKTFSHMVEQYSIDECFVQFEVDTNNVEEERVKMESIAKEIRKTVFSKTGIPVRVSIGETKTLAKVGSEYTKKMLKEGQVPAVCFWEHPDKENFLATLPVKDIWGIGWQWSKKLEALGFTTAKELLEEDPKKILKTFSVVLERTVLELSGIPSIAFESEPAVRKSLVRSRMFAHKINDPKYIRQAIATHLSRAVEELRKDKLLATELSIFMSTGKHADSKKYNYAHQTLLRPTNDTLVLSEVANKLFDECYIKADQFGKEYRYSKAGVSLSGFSSMDTFSEPLFEMDYTERPTLMKTLDAINRRFGKHAIVQASMGAPQKLKAVEAAKGEIIEWGMKREHMSKRFTTVWDELLNVKL